MTDLEYLPVEDVAVMLKLSVRQAMRYKTWDGGMRTQRSGRRILFHRDDVSRLAAELGAEYRVPVLATSYIHFHCSFHAFAQAALLYS
ncbi:MAG: hypothetical protein NVS4B8_24400 [Herpetosiphon sp.]